jgi:hypothetical protein
MSFNRQLVVGTAVAPPPDGPRPFLYRPLHYAWEIVMMLPDGDDRESVIVVAYLRCQRHVL